MENIFEELDEPGEWFYNKQTGALYFYPEEGVYLSTAQTEVPQLKHLVELHGDSQNPIKNINFEDIVFEHTARTFMEPFEKLLRSDL